MTARVPMPTVEPPDDTVRPAKRATKRELRREIEQLRSVGGLLSNVAYNFGRNGDAELTEDNQRLLRDLQERWDEIPRAE